jgi:predicted ester cyclase
MQVYFTASPPTGKRISVCGFNYYMIEDGKILQEWEQMDSLGMLQQMGVLPPVSRDTHS